MRYSEIGARIGGISKKIPTQTLRRLAVNGLVARHDSAEFCLTPLGESLLPPVVGAA
jgi:DNA-binding HxlR family transcriptional regulator